MAPEVFKHCKYDKKVDVFSFAMILYEMLEAEPPMSNYEAYEAAKSVAEGHKPIFKSKGYIPELKEYVNYQVKSRMKGDPSYKGTIYCFLKTLKIDGSFAFYKGFIPNFGRLDSWNVIILLTLEQKSAGGVLLPKSAVKFERYLMGEILAVGTEVGDLEAWKKVLFSDVNAYEVDLGAEGIHCFCKAGDLLVVVE